MPTKVNGSNNGTTAPVQNGQAVRRPQDTSVSDGQSKTGPAPTPSVSITDSARQLAALEQAVNAAPLVNNEKVAKIGKAVDEGTYTVDPEKVADKLMQMEQSLYIAGPTTG